MPPEATSLFRKCSRCGATMELKKPVWIATSEDDEPPTELKDWEFLRDNPHIAVVKHAEGECPDQIEARAAAAAGQHDYQVKVTVLRDGEPVIEFPSDIERAGTWDEVKVRLAEQLSERWQRAANLGAMIDVPVLSPPVVDVGEPEEARQVDHDIEEQVSSTEAVSDAGGDPAES